MTGNALRTPMPKVRLTAQNLSFRRGDRVLVEGLDLVLENGQALVVTGPNGAGKSTLLRGLAGLLPPFRGEAHAVYADGERMSPGALAHYVGHAEGSKPALTARENLDFWRSMLALPDLPGLDGPDEALALLGVPHIADLPVAYLSAGQKRRVGLARLLLAPRPIWILDEPLTALDRTGQDLLRTLMRDHLARGGVVIAATHAPLGISAFELALDARDAA